MENSSNLEGSSSQIVSDFPSLNSTSSAQLHISLTSEFAHLIGIDSEDEGNNHSETSYLDDFELDDSSDVASIVSNASSGRNVVRGTFVFVRDMPERKTSESKLEEMANSHALNQTKKEIARLRRQARARKMFLYGSTKEANVLEKLDEDLFSELEGSISLPCEELNGNSTDEDSKDEMLTSIEEEVGLKTADEDEFKHQIVSAMEEAEDASLPEGERELSRLQTRVASLENTLKKLRKKEQDAFRKVKLLQASNRRMKQHVEERRTEFVSVQTELALSTERCKHLESVYAETQKKQNNYSLELKKKDEKIDALQSVIRRLKGECSQQELQNLSIPELQEMITLHSEGLSAAQQALTDKLLQEKKLLEESQTCVVCLDQPIGIVLTPCGHHILCEICAQKVDVCPLDRQQIDKRIKAFGK